MIDRQTENVAPLLVQLYDTHRVYALAKDKRGEARAELTNIIMDLFVHELNARESELVADVLISLVKQVEREFKQSIAEKLAENDKIPLRLILHFANEEIDVAERVLIDSEVLSNVDLMYIIQSKGCEHWRAIAKRKALSARVIDMLADSKDIETAHNLAENKMITVTDYAYSVLEEMAEKDGDLADSLISRRDIPSVIAFRLYEAVSEELKNAIIVKFPTLEKEISEGVEQVLVDFSEGREPERKTPDRGAMVFAESMKSGGVLDVEMILQSLRKANISSFIAQMSVYTGVSVDAINSILGHEYGQGLAVICVAHGINKQDFLSMYLLTSRVRHSNRYIGRDEIFRASECYSHFSKEEAEEIIANSDWDKIDRLCFLN